jgi:hypothetical protein
LSADAKSVCRGLAGGIDNIKVMAGVSVGAGSAGTIAGGTALVSGLMKKKTDEKIADLEDMTPIELYKYAERLEKEAKDLDAEKERLKQQSQTLGAVRTVGSFVSGGTQVAGAASSFIGLKQLDDLADNMDKCNKAVKEIDNLRLRAQVEIPDESATIAEMAKITNGCGRLDSGNIRNIKGQLTASGVIMSVGGVLGVAGGVTSAVAGNKEKTGASATTAGKDGGTKELNTASNALAGASAATALAGTIIGGVTLSGLIKNGDIAKKCEEAF